MIRVVCVFAILFLLIGCSDGYPETPEEVVKKYTAYLNNGDCEGAEKFCFGNALSIINTLSEAGCEPIDLSIDSVICEIRDTNCVCKCYETRPIIGSYETFYHLVLDCGKWKLDRLTKSELGPWSWIDYGYDKFMSGYDKFENPVEVMDLIFSNYIKYDNGNESDDDIEAMQECLNQLGTDLTKTDLILVLNIWMYYNVIEFDVKGVTESILQRNRQNSIKAINERLSHPKFGEKNNFGPFRKLQTLKEKL